MYMTYDKDNPYFAAVKTRYSLCKGASDKSTQHIELCLRGSGLNYNAGDSIAILPQHDSSLVKQTLEALRAEPHIEVVDKRTGVTHQLESFLTHKANITEVSRKFLTEIQIRQKDQLKAEKLKKLLEEKELLKLYLAQTEAWQILKEHDEVSLTPQEFVDLLMPLLPRFYSISSSPYALPEEVHLTVAMVEYDQGGYTRRGVCTHYLCNLCPESERAVPIYLHPHRGFTLPSDPNAPIIMVGPGTGIAPFRSFMQERIAKKTSGKNWLFFGERTAAGEFFYEEFWKEAEALGKLKLSLAFSRDQAHKVYVQHRMLEEARELFRWLEEGAYFYVCGDAHKMARDVENALLEIIRKEGALDEALAKEYLKRLRKENRYLRDVY